MISLPVFFFILGAIVGSFLNVVVLRYGFRERKAERSHCASCATQLSAIDLIPVLSYVALRGRCRSCGSLLAIQYPLVEIATGVLFAATAVLIPVGTIADGVLFLALLGFWASFVALVAYDVRHTLIPVPFLYALAAFATLGLIAKTYVSGVAVLQDGVLGAALCGGFFAAIHVATRGRGMGLGDAWVAGAIGALFGLSGGIAAATLGVWSGAVIGIVLLLVVRFFPHAGPRFGARRVTLKTEIPFAPFLLLGAFVTFVFELHALGIAGLFI